ncbi:hypothetical protein BMS3Abin04_02533 [bacterium BMS3Abin04]|nr:hypothetical protein BMS3Abin04_02533 [bacterium BMS3Abin04]
MKDYEIKISQFVDNELPVNEQQELFRFLSESEEARRVLADYMEIKNKTKSFYTDMDVESDDSKIIGAVLGKGDHRKKYKSLFYFSAAAAIVLAFLLLSIFFNNSIEPEKYQELQTKYIALQREYITALNEKGELAKLNNNLSAEIEEVNVKQLPALHKPVIHKKKLNIKKKRSRKPGGQIFRNRNVYAANIPVYTITKNDFLGQQIIGN